MAVLMFRNVFDGETSEKRTPTGLENFVRY